jgi:hypothetical protein
MDCSYIMLFYRNSANYLVVTFLCMPWQVAEAEDTTPGGLILTETTKEKPSIGTVSPEHQFPFRNFIVFIL